MSLEPGAQLGDYRILSRIGAGACGEVFEGEHIITRRRDAIKMLSDGRHHVAEDEQRFLREIRVQASLHHPNIAAVYNAFWTPDGLALVMELVRGEPLSMALGRGRMPFEQGIRLLLDMLAGLSYAHSQGVVHRDIKPDNVIVTPDGTVKLTDFGLARSVASPRLTQPGAFAGSPCYMSPEQALGTGAIDARSDTYSAGVVLYEVVTGQLPFIGETAFAVMLAHRNSAPQPPIEIDPTLGEELNQVILKALEKNVDLRFQTAAEFHSALDAVIRPAVPAVVAPVAAGWRAAPKRLLLVAGVGPALAAGIFYAAVHRPAPQQPVTAPAAPAQVATQVDPPPPTVSAPAEPQPAPDEPSPEPEPPKPQPRPQVPKAKKPAPPPATTVRIIGMPDDPPPAQPHPVVKQAEFSKELSPATPERLKPPAAEHPKPADATTAPAVESERDATKSDPTRSDPTKPAATPKKRNPVVRAFQKVFGGHHEGDPPARTETVKQPN